MFRSINYLIVGVALSSSLFGAAARAQQPVTTARPDSVYCGGVVTPEHVPSDLYVISGPEAEITTTFAEGKYVYISKGANQGVKLGDQFLASRPLKEEVRIPWFHGQQSLMRSMGTLYADLGRLQVVDVEANTSTAQIVLSCAYLQRGDILQPFTERVAPPVKTEAPAAERFVRPSGKGSAMIVFTREFGQVAGSGTIVYVNLGGAQGVKVGDYFRIYRNHEQKGHEETVYHVKDASYKLYGFGSTPRPYTSSELPRDVVGEGVVLRVGPNAATVVITNTQRPAFTGDYVELE